MEKRQTEVKNLRPNGFVLLDDEPCIVEDVSISKPGKHGGAKARLSSMGVFDGKRRIIVKPADARVDVPVIEKRNMQVVAISGNNVQVMDLEDYGMAELPLPEGIAVNEGDELLVWRWGNKMLIKGKK